MLKQGGINTTILKQLSARYASSSNAKKLRDLEKHLKRKGWRLDSMFRKQSGLSIGTEKTQLISCLL